MRKVLPLWHGMEMQRRPIDYSVSDSRVEFAPAPTPCSRSSLSHAHRSMGLFRNQTFALAAADSARPIDYSVSDIRVEFTPAPTPCSCSSLSDAHRSIGFFHNQTFDLAAADSERPIDYSVSDSRVASKSSSST